MVSGAGSVCRGTGVHPGYTQTMSIKVLARVVALASS